METENVAEDVSRRSKSAATSSYLPIRYSLEEICVGSWPEKQTQKATYK